MKKILFLVAGLVMAGGALAQSTTVVLGSDNNYTVKTTDCALLNENVKINLTSNVGGAVACNDKAIAIAACHSGGRTTSREVEKLNCTTTDGVETCVSYTPKQYETSTGAAVATANTIAGTVISKYPGSTCDADGNTASSVASASLQ